MVNWRSDPERSNECHPSMCLSEEKQTHADMTDGIDCSAADERFALLLFVLVFFFLLLLLSLITAYHIDVERHLR